MVTPGKDADADRALLARALGALIAVRRFDTPMQIARAVHTGTLALRMFSSSLGEAEMARLKALNARAVDGISFSEADRDWLMTTIRRILGKAGATEPVEERIH